MKQIIFLCLLPFILSLSALYYIALNKQVNNLLFKENIEKNYVNSESNYIENFYKCPICEEQFLKNSNRTETIYLLGSSELTDITDAIPFNFISQHFTTRVIGVGHAGNQCLSIYSQLIANEQRLKNAPIVIILSPGWFESKASKGTSSEVFLEYNSERFLNKIIKNETDSKFHAYLYKRITQLYNEFNSPNIELKLMNFKYYASKSIIHSAIYSPLIFCDNTLLHLKEKIIPQIKPDNVHFKRISIVPEAVSINWDSLYNVSKKEVIKKSTNNNWGINNEYFTEYIHGKKKGHMETVCEMFNKELDDFKMLVKLLKEKKANASFIISPLNALYYQNLKNILPTINIIENEIKKCGFNYLNLLETDTTKYDKAILRDIMHMSDYGWYKVNHFIINTYHLSK